MHGQPSVKYALSGQSRVYLIFMTWHLALPRFCFQPTMQPKCTHKSQDKPKPYYNTPVGVAV